MNMKKNIKISIGLAAAGLLVPAERGTESPQSVRGGQAALPDSPHTAAAGT